MSKSILQNEKECYYSHTTYNIEKHHIFYGTANKKLSEKWGCWVYLRHDLHNEPPAGVHHNKDNDLKLKQECQRAFEEKYGHEKFMQIFGRNYL